MSIEFFNKFSATLIIELDIPPHQVGELLNQYAAESAKIKSVKFNVSAVDYRNVNRPPSDSELDVIVFKQTTLNLCSDLDLRAARLPDSKVIVAHSAPNGKYFTVRDVIAAIEATEFQTRQHTDWFGGVDVHHIFFEGIHRHPYRHEEVTESAWEICWGS